jgi:hypothetical protein
MVSRVNVTLEESDNEETAAPDIDQGPSSASRALGIPIPGKQDDVPVEREPVILSVVADRTRNKKKAAAVHDAPANDASGSEHSNREEEVPMPRGKKRKAAGKEDGDGNEANAKKVKAKS